MKISATKLTIRGALLLKRYHSSDSRGSMEKYFEHELRGRLGFEPTEALVSSSKKGVVRGLHYQNPGAQPKLAWCISGSAYDVLLDMRQSSPTFGKWQAVKISAKAGNGVFVPKGVAHGFQALEHGTKILYLLGGKHAKSSDRGVLYSDRRLAILWPIKKAIVSARDQSFPPFALAKKFR